MLLSIEFHPAARIYIFERDTNAALFNCLINELPDDFDIAKIDGENMGVRIRLSKTGMYRIPCEFDLEGGRLFMARDTIDCDDRPDMVEMLRGLIKKYEVSGGEDPKTVAGKIWDRIKKRGST